MAERPEPTSPDAGPPSSPDRGRDTDFGHVESWFAALGLPSRATRPAALGQDDPSTLIDMLEADAAELPAGEPVAAGLERPARRASDRPGATHSEWPAVPDAPATPPRDARPASPTAPAAGAAPAVDPVAAGGPGLSARLYGAFALARVLLALVLAGLPWAQGLLSMALPQPQHGLAAAAYALATLAAWRRPAAAGAALTPGGLLRRGGLLATIGVDLLAFAVFLDMLGGSVNVAALFAVPVLMAGTLSGRLIALATAAASTFVLLGHGLLAWEGAEAPALYTQTGLTCAGLFALAWLTSELTTRLAREERSARSSLALARQQALLNRLVIEEMEDGILVVDRTGRVRVANPAALRLIDAPPEHRLRVFSLHDRLRWRPLLDALEQAFRAGAWPEGGRDLVLAAPDQAAAARAGEDRPLRVRLRFTRRRQQELGESLCVVFLEDVRTLRLRARQDKLAAMGRVSAGIAHEIRNPLAAIAQANALLAEDLTHPAQQRLARMVDDNVDRLRRIVDDIMAAAPGGAERTPPLIDLVGHVRQIVGDWVETNGLGAAGRVHLELPSAAAVSGPPVVPVRIEPDHLARVLVNLLDNALHHGSTEPGAIRVGLGLALRARAGDPPERARALAHQRGGPRQATLRVASDGAAIPSEVEPLLFEPFFSTRSRGTGLGLYICRELCERHGVSIDYRRVAAPARHPNVFVLRLPVADDDNGPTIAS